MPEPQFVSEPIEPVGGPRETGAMVRGEPGLPGAFRWRGDDYDVALVLDRGKATRSDRGEQYVKRHTYRLEMNDGAVWSVYALRHPPYGWFLKSVTPSAP